MTPSRIKLLEQLYEYFFLGAIFALPLSIAVMEVCLGLSFMCWLMLKWVKKEPMCHDQTLVILAGIFIGISSISAFNSGYPLLAAQGLIKISKYALVMLVTFDLFRDPVKSKRLLFVAVIGFALVLLDSFLQMILGLDLINGYPIQFTDLNTRLTGPYKSYGLLAAHIIGMAPVALSLAFASEPYHLKAWKKAALVLLFAASLYILYHTHSRGAWTASAASWVVYTLMLKRKWLVVPLLITMFTAPFILPRNAILHLDLQRKEQSIRERAHLWYRAIQVIQNRPLFGCGINTYIENYPKFDKRKSWRVPGYYAHNGYLQMAAETGLISLFFFLLLIGKAIRSGFISYHRAHGERRLFTIGLMTGTLALLFHAMVDTTLHNLQSAILIWCFFGLLSALKTQTERSG
ncbi:MAG: hypothetical protein A3J52_00155 [Omnitrophica bacterium RIFCSPHIGHO2_02_FULL_49_9]|nr:MAG: hypothetical protein A3J52_00155 [Omnitrophica bacterium RIFCSPHIGHO2_02_FULL_49_9]OGW89768.1 MAG: hypothetical protein A3A73_02440 [Omnitrophica bacterium RIFCSPLOWO2_01_FULL_50_24]